MPDSGSFETINVKLDMIAEHVKSIEIKVDSVVALQQTHGERIAVNEFQLKQLPQHLRDIESKIEDKADCDDVTRLHGKMQGLTEKQDQQYALLLTQIQALQVKQAVTWTKLTLTGGGSAVIGSLLTIAAKYLLPGV